MSVTTVTPVDLTINTRSADILDSDGTVATTPADGWEVDLTTYLNRPILFKFLADNTGDTVTITAGDRPPSMHGGVAALTVVLAASDVRYIVLEMARVLQNDGYVRATCVDAGTSMKVFVLPKVG